MVKNTSDKKLDLLINAVEKLVANPVAPVLPVLPIAPIAPIAPIDDSRLTRVEVKIDGLKDDIKNLNDGTTLKISDHEIRIRIMETNLTRVMTWGTVGILLLGVAEFIINKFL